MNWSWFCMCRVSVFWLLVLLSTLRLFVTGSQDCYEILTTYHHLVTRFWHLSYSNKLQTLLISILKGYFENHNLDLISWGDRLDGGNMLRWIWFSYLSKIKSRSFPFSVFVSFSKNPTKKRAVDNWPKYQAIKSNFKLSFMRYLSHGCPIFSSAAITYSQSLSQRTIFIELYFDICAIPCPQPTISYSPPLVLIYWLPPSTQPHNIQSLIYLFYHFANA